MAASRFFLDLGLSKSLVQLPPYALRPELISWLEARGYRPGARWVKLWRRLDQLPAQSSLRIEQNGIAEAEMFGEVCLTAFEMPPQGPRHRDGDDRTPGVDPLPGLRRRHAGEHRRPARQRRRRLARLRRDAREVSRTRLANRHVRSAAR